MDKTKDLDGNDDGDVIRKAETLVTGVIFNNGVMLAADAGGPWTAGQSGKKIFCLSDNIFCCGDIDAELIEIISEIRYQLELEGFSSSGRDIPVAQALTLLLESLPQRDDHTNAFLIVGGVDAEGSHIYLVSPSGASEKLKYAAMGTGCIAAMSILETTWTQNMTEIQAKELVRKTVYVGTFGKSQPLTNLYLCLIRKEFVENGILAVANKLDHE